MPREGPSLVWDAVLGLGALAYILLALFDGIDSPLVGFALIVVVGRRLLQGHDARRG